MPTKSLLFKSIACVAQNLASATIIIGAFWTAPVWAKTLNFEQIYVFGDSLSDTGNFYNWTGFSFPPEPFYSQGRFTNGDNWINFLSEELDLSPELYTSLPPGSTNIPRDGINFAFGGATTSNNLGGPPFLGLEGQIDAFTNLLGDRAANSEALYTVWAGSNDYIGFFQNNPNVSEPKPKEIVNNLTSALTTLAEAGANDILVTNLPNLGKTPFARSLGKKDANQLKKLSKRHNNLLAKSIDQLNQSYDTNFITLDVDALFQDILASAKNDDDDDDNGFGFTNVTDNCSGVDFPNVPIFPSQEDLEKLNNCLDNNPDEFLFWDNQHPTTEGHKVIAESALDVLKSEFHGDDDDDDDDDDDFGSDDKEDNILVQVSDSKLGDSTSVFEPTSSFGIDDDNDYNSEDKEDNTLAQVSNSKLGNSTSVFEPNSSLGILAIGLSSVGSWLLSKKHRKS